MPDPRVRRIEESDVPEVVRMVHDLAAYENIPDCRLTEEALASALFAPRPALFAHVAEADDAVVGCALWFLNYSTFRGSHGIYLEDLYVKPEYRGAGLGKALLTALAEECVRRGYARLEWSVLDWNTPSIGFYRSLGAEPLDEWTVYRLTDEALQKLGSGA